MTEGIFRHHDTVLIAGIATMVVDRLAESEREPGRHAHGGIERRCRRDRAHRREPLRVDEVHSVDGAAYRQHAVHTREGTRVADPAEGRELGRMRRPRVDEPRGERETRVHDDGRGDRRRIGERDPVEARDRVVRAGEVGGNRRRDPRLVLLGQPDPEVDAEWISDLAAEERPDRLPGDAAHDLADEVAEGERVVAVARARLPEWFHLGQPPDDEVPVEVARVGDGLAKADETGLVREQHPHGDRVLAVLGELGPVGRDGRVEVEVAARHEHVGAQRRRTFGARPNDTNRVVFPGAPGRGVGDATPQVDNRLTVDRDAHRRTDLAALGEVAVELVADGLESRGTQTVARHGRDVTTREQTIQR